MEMNCVSQKAHFMMESVMMASLQAQLKAKMAPGPLADDPALADPAPDPLEAPPNELGRLPLAPDVSVLSQSFCRAASGLDDVPPADEPDSPSNMEERALRLACGRVSGV